MDIKPFFICFLGISIVLQGCDPKVKKPTSFVVLNGSKTGLNFTNKLTPTPSFNMFKYMYFYNGAGVGAGDFNNDGLVDLFFSSNQSNNHIFLNEGALQFKDVTTEARIPQDSGWSTGVSVVDINNDGLLDIYVCKVGNFETLHGKNQLLVCSGINKNGIPQYENKAEQYGLDFSGFSTQAAFMDYDSDGDLDMFLLNHSVHQNGTFAARKVFLGTYHPLTGHRIYRNDGTKFTDVTRQTGINSSAIGYGLGVCVSDIDLDGFPDLYVGNDFHENDYLYINQKNGTFSEELNSQIMHTSQFSMGVDIADINNDAFPEIITMDMLPSDPYILKRSLGEDEYNTFYMKIGYGYNYQYAKNALQLNRKNNQFSEVGMYAGVSATDWSWAPLWMDFDNDGLKDLFVSNGIPKRLNDIDYVNYVSNEDIQSKIKSNSIGDKEMSVIDNFPQIKLPNKFFKNKGHVSFEDIEEEIEGDVATYSNGSAYADFDNDGDLDIVVNNIDEAVLLYQNKANDHQSNDFLRISLKGPEKNINAVGAKVVLFVKDSIRTYEKYPVRGFQSSMEIPLQIGLKNTTVDSAFLIWPDNSYQKLLWSKGQTNQEMSYVKGLPVFNYATLKKNSRIATKPLVDITKSTNLLFKHHENPFNEFDREPLLPHMVSREGPALAMADVNHDGLDDVFVGSSKGTKSALFIQGKAGVFEQSVQSALDNDSTYEDVDAHWVDVNNDQHLDLVVASGGNEYYGKDEHLIPRIYINDGKLKLTKLEQAFPKFESTISCIEPYDINKDGYMDLFVGGRCFPWEYGQTPSSYILINDGQGHFKDATETYSKELLSVGFVTDARWVDMDKDGDEDLLVSLEWDGVCLFINEGNRLVKKYLTKKKGWWNFTLPCDIDGDGDLDLIAGNLGLNTRLTASQKEPVQLYFNDFDGNGKKEQVLTYYLEGRQLPFANKAELEKQIPILKKRFLYAENFAKASLGEIFTKERLNEATVLTADYFQNAVLINEGGLNFSVQPLPWEAQLSPYKDAIVVMANDDPFPDIFMVGNYYENNIQMGRYDADYGLLLINNGRGKYRCEKPNGLAIKGQVRHIQKLKTGNGEALVLAKNNDSLMVVQFQDGVKNLRAKN